MIMVSVAHQEPGTAQVGRVSRARQAWGLVDGCTGARMHSRLTDT